MVKQSNETAGWLLLICAGVLIVGLGWFLLSCKKAAIEHIAGHPVSWMDVFVL